MNKPVLTAARMDFDSLCPLLDDAIASRRGLIEASAASNQTSDRVSHVEAFRLFNGFYEGCPDIVVDVYGSTLVIYDHSQTPDDKFIHDLSEHIHNILIWLRASIVKKRNASTQAEKRGVVTFGKEIAHKIVEHGVWYAIDLTMNRDVGFYLDTRNLRKWIIENLHGKTVLNTFAYTGALGVAAAASGGKEVIQTDANRKVLEIAKESMLLNNLPFQKRNFIAGDFFPVIARLKSEKRLFDCVILDPPFFSVTSRGKVDLIHESGRLINKVRPLISDGGTLIAINNAVYLSGADHMNTLDSLCKDGYLSVRDLIPVPEDFIGYNRVGKPITDPAPFNHSTKIVILDVRRKS
jgi:23S rRNA (cytosine1962-C5)-methyltransferase